MPFASRFSLFPACKVFHRIEGGIPVKAGLVATLFAIAFLFVLASSNTRGDTKDLKTGAFQVQQELMLPASPEAVYDAVTGDISGWWDHSFSAHPKKLYIEAKPGGGFYEIFNDSGDGALHATVIYAERGKRLR